jgi:ATP/maltotriose-dependent transcriptional regulator MalT
VELLERETELAVFETAFAATARGEGRVLLVSGEAGLGKTTLVRALVDRVADRARVLLGACDDLLTPRTLGPFRDLRLGESSPLRRALEDGADRDAVFGAVLEECRDPLRPTVLVVEDAHWADEATRDVLAFLGRRVAGMPTLVVVTYRDELAVDHPLRAVLGGLAGPGVHRLLLQPLSDDALRTLASGGTVAPDRLRELTGGNPFLVAEVLAAADPTTVPLTVRDAVAARLARLDLSARDVLVLLAVAPAGLELELLGRLDPHALEDVAATERLGLTEVVDGRVRFRHDLLRDAVSATATAAATTHAHARILAALGTADPEPSRAAHHAVGAGDVPAIARFAPPTARRAMAVASHRDAIVLLEQALRHETHLDPAHHIDLLRWYAFELYLANRHRDAQRAAARAVRMLEEVGAAPTGAHAPADAPTHANGEHVPGEALGKALTLLSHVACWAAQPQVAREAAARSRAALAGASPEPRAVAAANHAFVLAMQGDLARSVTAAAEAAELTCEPALRHVRPYALIQLGAATALGGDRAGDELLEQGVELAQEVGRHEYVPLGCTWRSMSAIRHARPDEVERWTSFGIRYADQHQIDVGVTTLRMLQHELQLRRGELGAAEAGLRDLVADVEATAWGQSAACTLLGRLLARRGDEAPAFELLGRGWRLALQSDEPERLARAAAGWYEWAQLYDDPQARRWGDEGLAVTRTADNPWLLGELLRLRAELDAPPLERVEAEVCGPWADGLRGAWRAAAAGWARLGWPYEQARELAASGEVPAMVEALAIHDRLGTERAAWQLRRRLRERGVRRVPRGPARDTRANPAGLTTRQLEVLRLLAAGRTNTQIAEELVVSTRTVDHHVSAVLSKLGVPSRAEAARVAAELGLTAPAG